MKTEAEKGKSKVTKRQCKNTESAIQEALYSLWENFLSTDCSMPMHA